jgi:beta-glucanase (GH16 family)
LGRKQPVLEENFTNPIELETLWTLQSDDNPGLKSCRRPENVVITSSELQLRTLNAVDCRAKWSAGSMISKTRQRYGFFEARMKIANISGLNNAFWLVTTDHFEIDIAEVHYPNDVRLTLHNNNNWDTEKEDKMGFDSKFADNFSQDYHYYGVLWTPKEIIFEIDGEPIAAIETNGAIRAAADIRFSTAVTEFGGKIPSNPRPCKASAVYIATPRITLSSLQLRSSGPVVAINAQ